MSWPEPVTHERPATVADEFQEFLTDHGTKLRAAKQEAAEQKRAEAAHRKARAEAVIDQLFATMDDPDE